MKRSANQTTLFSLGFLSWDNPPSQKKAQSPVALEDNEELLLIESDVDDERDVNPRVDQSLNPSTSTVPCPIMQSISVSATSGESHSSFTNLCPPYDIGEVAQFA